MLTLLRGSLLIGITHAHGHLRLTGHRGRLHSSVHLLRKTALELVLHGASLRTLWYDTTVESNCGLSLTSIFDMKKLLVALLFVVRLHKTAGVSWYSSGRVWMKGERNKG